mmetsp:Transcript_8678/g.15911  ORF Transcript_8678/g.15911 Transcript_8678/m.15911 type:complete len:425 (-) Transcript_8678:262-1536(-)
MSIEGILSQLSYPNHVRVQADVLALQNKYAALVPKASTHIHNDGTESFLLMLEGTIPITYKGATYNIPIEVIVSAAYPSTAPLCFVRPVKGMEVKRDHRHVAMDGSVHLPYLTSWRGENTLVTLADNMASAFSLQPPVFATRPDSQRPQRPQQQQQQQQVQQPTPPPPYRPVPVTGGNGNARGVELNGEGTHAGGGAGAGDGDGILGDPRSTALRELTDKLRRHLQEVVSAGTKETEEEYRRRPCLESKLQDVESQIVALTTHKHDLEEALTVAVTANSEFEAWLHEQRFKEEAVKIGAVAAAERSLGDVGGDDSSRSGKSSAPTGSGGVGGDGTGGTDTGSALASLPVKPAGALSSKLLELVAESCAIEDTLYALDRGLMRECVSVGEFMKQVRVLSRKQFFVQAHIQKVHRAQREQDRLHSN